MNIVEESMTRDNDKRIIMQWIDRDQEEIVVFLSRLVQCKTPSTIGDTREAVSLIEGFFDRDGIPYEEHAYCKTMPNIISSFTDRGSVKYGPRPYAGSLRVPETNMNLRR